MNKTAKMASSRKPSGNIHKIREFELDKVTLSDEFDILQIVGEGWFGKILLVEHRATDTEMVLKALPKPYVSLNDFYKEFHYSLHLGQHKNIVTTYDVAFETAGFYVFTQEYAPLGDLTSNVSETGIGELHTKRVARQLASALDYMHIREMVHRDVKLDNVLVFRSDFARIKLCDFGESRQTTSFVQRRNEWLPYSPPEVLSVKTDDSYKTETSHDVWQFGIVVFVCLTGCLPWQKAALDDPRYNRYLAWHNTTLTFPMKRCPKLFKLLSARACKMFKKFLDPRSERRLKTISDLQKYLDDRWLAKTAEKDLAANETDELCPSMYSFHSSLDEKNKLLFTLAQCGIETTVDRVAKKNRIRDWIQSSVIVEEDEEEDSGTATPNSNVSRTAVPGHVSSLAVLEKTQNVINTTVKEASNKHIDPRTGYVQIGIPSEMGTKTEQTLYNNSNSNNNNEKQPNYYEQTAINHRTNGSVPEKPEPPKFQPNVIAKSSSLGLMKAFNSVAAVSVPEIIKSKSQDMIKDSGYGSTEGTKPNQKPGVMKSPILSKRVITKLPNENVSSFSQDTSNDFETLELNRGSNGFVNFVNGRKPLKDSPYDRFIYRRK